MVRAFVRTTFLRCYLPVSQKICIFAQLLRPDVNAVAETSCDNFYNRLTDNKI